MFSLTNKPLQGLNGIELRPPLLGNLTMVILFHIRVRLLCSKGKYQLVSEPRPASIYVWKQLDSSTAEARIDDWRLCLQKSKRCIYVSWNSAIQLETRLRHKHKSQPSSSVQMVPLQMSLFICKLDWPSRCENTDKITNTITVGHCQSQESKLRWQTHFGIVTTGPTVHSTTMLSVGEQRINSSSGVFWQKWKVCFRTEHLSVTGPKCGGSHLVPLLPCWKWLH